jgi:branched-chain amino acid transport system permease protein
MSDLLPQIVQQLFNGLSLGAIYALIAIGYTMVYGIIGMINFAHGEIYMIGAYVGLVTLTAIGVGSGLPIWLIILIMLLVAMLVTAVYGYAIEKVAYAPLRGSPRLVPLISAIGMSIFLQNWVALGQGARDMAVPALLTGSFQFSLGSDGFTVTAPYSRVMIIVVTVVLMIMLSLYIKYSRLGRASRACSQDLRMANLLGIDTNKIISFTFIIGAMLAAVGGVLIATAIGKLKPLYRLYCRHQSLYSRRAGRDWQHPRRHAGRSLARFGRNLCRCLYFVAVQGHRGLFTVGLYPAVPPNGPAG